LLPEANMTSITVALPEDQLQKLQALAARLSVAPEELARVGIEELLSRPEDAFEEAAIYLLQKNADLYLRLA
jgi:predicted transcriptional regulator